ncbi:Ig-like domain-containing protein [Gammaproteobacteria bacterium]|nr:Ig-like domain-containing protein [Gammaproteobacteria bacterium]
MNYYLKNAALVFSVFIITSCGGGGGGGGGTTPIQALAAVISSFVSGESSVKIDTSVDLTWASSNATSCTASGSWSGTKSVNGTESVPIVSVGNNSFILTCNGEGGNSTKTVNVEGYRDIKGITVDGYVSGATIFIDQNNNYVLDTEEDSTSSGNDGTFSIKQSNGVLVSLGGQDIDTLTQLDSLMLLRNVAGYSESDFLITPVTSVDNFLCINTADSCANGGGDINTVLGIDSSINVNTFDPVANKGDGGINDYLYEKGNQLTILASALTKIANNLNTSTESTEDYFKSIAETIDAEFLQTAAKVDIETNTFITNALEKVIEAKALTLDETAKLNTINALSGVMPLIAINDSSEITTALISFGLNTLQTDIVSIANGTADLSTLNSYQNDIFNYIATDQSIDSNELVPNISSVQDVASTNEDVSVSINVLANDSYTTSAPVSISLTQPSHGAATLDGYVVLYTPNQDFNGTDSFAYTISQGSKTSTSDVTITIDSINDSPVINVASTIQVEENQLSVTSISVSDADNDPLSLTMNGVDSDSFNLSSDNILTFNSPKDYEEDQKSYSLFFELTDGKEVINKSLTVNLKNVNDVKPEWDDGYGGTFPDGFEISLDTDENDIEPIGQVRAFDDIEEDTIQYSLEGDDANLLSISSDGLVTFKQAPDYETKTEYAYDIVASDGVNKIYLIIDHFITNLNDVAPVITSESTLSADENQTVIGTVSISDPDPGTLSFVISGDDSSLVSINRDGDIRFLTAPDYETKISYSFSITVSDGVNTSTTAFIININDLDDVFTDVAGYRVPTSIDVIETKE